MQLIHHYSAIDQELFEFEDIMSECRADEEPDKATEDYKAEDPNVLLELITEYIADDTKSAANKEQSVHPERLGEDATFGLPRSLFSSSAHEDSKASQGPTSSSMTISEIPPSFTTCRREEPVESFMEISEIMNELISTAPPTTSTFSFVKGEPYSFDCRAPRQAQQVTQPCAIPARSLFVYPTIGEPITNTSVSTYSTRSYDMDSYNAYRVSPISSPSYSDSAIDSSIGQRNYRTPYNEFSDDSWVQYGHLQTSTRTKSSSDASDIECAHFIHNVDETTCAPVFRNNAGSTSSNADILEYTARVNIQGLRDVYYRRKNEGYGITGQCFADSVVSIDVRSDNAPITNVRVYMERCDDSVVPTDDYNTGPLELKPCFTQHGVFTTAFSVDLSSAFGAPSQERANTLEHAEQEQQIHWQLVIEVELAEKLRRCFTSRPFLIRCKERSDSSGSSEETIDDYTLQGFEGLMSEDFSSQGSHTTSCSEPLADKSANAFHDLSNVKELQKDWQQINREYQAAISKIVPSSTPSGVMSVASKPPPLLQAFGRVFLRSDTEVNVHEVAHKYNKDPIVRYVSEQPDFPGLLKVMKRRTQVEPMIRRRANGFRSAEEDFIWICGHCHFSRKKKSTVKSHVEQRVCKRSSERRELRNKRARLEWVNYGSQGNLHHGNKQANQ